jgi:phosphoenolpyruvate carboxylase
LLSFGSWIGGDMSTDTEISARTIRETFARQRALILDLYYNDCRSLAEKLSQSVSRVDVDKAVREQIEAYGKQFPGARGSTPHRYRDMPYRRLLRLICQRLQATYDESAFPYEDAGQFIADLRLIANSLARRKGTHAGLFAVERLIRRAETFGFHFMSVDLRYDATGLQQVIGYCLGESGWLEKTPEERAIRIQNVLDVNDSPTIEPDNNAKRLLAVFGAISYCRRKYGEQAIGVFLVRHCRGTDDILAVMLLARWAGLFSAEGSIPLDICPSFETTAELAISPGLVARLLKNDFYAANLKSLGNHQTVMLSTAGSGMECSFAASRWSTQQSHIQLKEILGASDIDCTLFHGRGSFSGRGGVADSIACGHLRATEHGESVNERYGVRGIALRTLEKAFNAVIVNTAGLDVTREDDSGWGDIMNTVAGTGDVCYAKLKGDGVDFMQYFRLATPIDVIERMQANQFNLRGDSDPMSRINVPWALAWAQSRYMLPSWFGIGAGLEAAFGKYGEAELRTMLQEWPFFARLIGDAETALAIADTGIALHYSELAGPRLHELFFPLIEDEYRRSTSALLKLKNQEKLLENNNTLRRSIRLRNPYVDPMSLLQVELLQRWRSGNREDDVLLAALLASVNGISRGLQTSG